jgi:hypothetical protein
MNNILLIHLFACFTMTGIIWLVQIHIYPLFKIVGKTEFKNFHDFHVKKISLIVAPLILLEVATAIWLLIIHQETFYLLNLISVVFLLLFTFFVNIPSHEKLNFESEKSKDNLISLNWIRTIVWTLRSIILFYLGVIS